MSLRIRADGRILCAAMHPEEPGDTYLHDGISYVLTVELRAVVSEPMSSAVGRGGHAKHGEWWWAHRVPADVVIEAVLVDGHTPRPWSANLDSDHGDYTIWGPGPHEFVANIGTDGVIAFDVSKANALLIVAAVNTFGARGEGGSE